VVHTRERQIPDGADHLSRRYDAGRELEYQVLSAGLSVRQVPERKANSELIEMLLQPRKDEAGENSNALYFVTISEEDSALLEARHLYADLMDLQDIGEIVRVSATRLSTRERDARMRAALAHKYEDYLPMFEIGKMGLTGSDAALVSLMFRSSIKKCGPPPYTPLGNLVSMKPSIEPHVLEIVAWLRLRWSYTRMPEDAMIPSLEPSRIRTAVSRLIDRLPEKIEVDGEEATHPAVAIIRGRLEEYNRETRTNNKENWQGLREIIQRRESAQTQEAAAKMGLTAEQYRSRTPKAYSLSDVPYRFGWSNLIGILDTSDCN
jgi:hypothetical protein